MSRLRICLLLLAISLTLCACKDDSTSNDDTQPSLAPTIQTGPTEPNDTTEPEQPSLPNITPEPVLPPVIPDNKPVMTPAQALYGASPSGYSIWTIPIGIGSIKRICVDLDGYKAFEMNGSEMDVAGVHHGGVLLKGENGRYFLRDVPSGELAFNSVNAEGIRIILPQHNGKEMFRDGYVLAVKPLDNAYEMGIMNPKGQWVVELTADFPLLPYLKADTSLANLEQEITYLGGAVIGYLCKDNVYRYYNISTNTMITPQFPKNLSKQTVYDALNYHVRFTDGISEPVFMNNNYYLFHTNGKVDSFNVLWPKGLPRATKCGAPYFDRTTKTAYFLYDYGSGILVCDNNGKIIQKHEGYKILNFQSTTAEHVPYSGFGADGYARIIVENKDGVQQYAVLGIDGEFLFEPLTLPDNTLAVYDLEGVYIQVNTGITDGEYLIINHQGTVCYSSDEVKDFSVRNGVLHFKEDDEDVYILVQTPALY